MAAVTDSYDAATAELNAEPDAVFMLQVKEQQFADAINTALGLELQAVAQMPGAGARAGRAP